MACWPGPLTSLHDDIIDQLIWLSHNKIPIEDFHFEAAADIFIANENRQLQLVLVKSVLEIVRYSSFSHLWFNAMCRAVKSCQNTNTCNRPIHRCVTV